jgi:Mce-associated membrane protein
MAVDVDASEHQLTTPPITGRDEAPAHRGSGPRTALIFGLTALLAVGGVAGWLGFRASQSAHTEQQREVFLQVGRQGTLNLTTIDYTRVDADVQRVLESSTGAFHAEFEQTSPEFVQVVKNSQSKTQGTVTEAGIESVTGDSARVLVGVSVATSNVAAPHQQPRFWRMRVDVQKVGGTVKVSNVGFVA